MVLDDVSESKSLEKQHQTNIIQMDDVCAVLGTAINMLGHVGDDFPWRKQCTLLATVIVHLIHPFVYIWGGRNRWMGVDGIG